MDVLAGGFAAFLAFLFSLILVLRWFRRRSPHDAAWAVSMGFFGLGAAALVWGASSGWDDTAFRLYYLCGAVLNVPWLALGSLHVLRRGRQRSSLMTGVEMAVVYFTIVAIPIVMTTGLVSEIPNEEIPQGKDLLVPSARVLAVTGNILGTFVVVGGALHSAARSRQRDEDKALFQGNLLVAAGVSVAAFSGVSLGLGVVASKAVGLAVAETLIFAGFLRTSGTSISPSFRAFVTGRRTALSVFFRRFQGRQLAPSPSASSPGPLLKLSTGFLPASAGLPRSDGLPLPGEECSVAWSADAMAEAVLAGLRQGDLATVAADSGLSLAVLTSWTELFVAGGTSALLRFESAHAETPEGKIPGTSLPCVPAGVPAVAASAVTERLEDAHRKIGELVMEIDRYSRMQVSQMSMLGDDAPR